MSVGRATNGLMTGQGLSGQICQHFQLHTSYRDFVGEPEAHCRWGAPRCRKHGYKA